MPFQVFEKLVPKVGELELFEFDWKVLLDIEVDLLLGGPIHEVDFVFVGEEHK